MKRIIVKSLNSTEFAPFGQVIEADEAKKLGFNDGAAHRYHDLAQITASGDAGRAIISIASSIHQDLPLQLHKVERHPLGSQAFFPLSKRPFLVIVAKDQNGIPSEPMAFITDNGQGINYNASTWHGVLTPLQERSDFLVVDREGNGNNCEEYMYDVPYLICFS